MGEMRRAIAREEAERSKQRPIRFYVGDCFLNYRPLCAWLVSRTSVDRRRIFRQSSRIASPWPAPSWTGWSGNRHFQKAKHGFRPIPIQSWG